MSDGQTDIDFGVHSAVKPGLPVKLLIAGPARVGKDTLADMLEGLSGGRLHKGLSTSEWYAATRLGKDWKRRLAELKATPKGRQELAHLIAFENRMSYGWPNCQIYAEMAAAGSNLLVGIRRMEEVRACVRLGLIDRAVWVWRDVPDDETLDYVLGGLCQTLPTTIIDNHGSLDELRIKAEAYWRQLCYETSTDVANCMRNDTETQGG